MTRALIIGGGIAGPAAAMALQKAGIEAVVYERHRGGTHQAGAFLTLGSNGIDALRVIDADERALEAGLPTPQIHVSSYTGKSLGVASIATRRADGTTSVTLRRADLYQAVNDEALDREIRIEHGKRLVDAEILPGGVRAVFADGSDATGDVLIGCDGVHSTVRTIIDPHAPAPAYAGLIGVGGYARDVAIDAPEGSFEMTFGKRAFFGYVAAPDGHVWWFANVPRRDEPARGEVEGVDPEAWRSRLLELFAADHGAAVELIKATDQIGRASPMHTVAHLPTWSRDRVIVIGDAAHAPSPSSGQGASLAIEDAVVLAKCLRDEADPARAFSHYESLRRPRVERIIKQAARVNNNKAATGLGRVLRDAILPLILRLTADSGHLRETYGYHIDWDEPVTAHPRA